MLILGDSKEKLKDLEDNSVDGLVSDPPYGMSFMGKDWDKALPDIEIWKESLRTMKPGSFGFVMCIPRQDCLSRMIISLEDAGFNINFSPIFWTMASGFPKAHNISKAVDKKFGVDIENKSEFKETSEQAPLNGKNNAVRYKVCSECGKLLFGAVGHRCECDWRNHIPATEQAKQFDGAYGGFQPKPAVEVIIVVQKPTTEKTFVAQALKNGKGITWLDDCRIPYKDEVITRNFDKQKDTGSDSSIALGKGRTGTWTNTQGRFPANLLVSDDVLDDGKEHKSQGGLCSNKWLADDKNIGKQIGMGDSGNYSRFFSLDAWTEKNLPFLIVPKASKAEKNKGLDELEEQHGNAFEGVNCPYCPDCGLTYNGTNDHSKCSGVVEHKPYKIQKNNHPTVKPIKLMSYLIQMGSREGDTILDPFMGSGTTGCAAALLRRDFVGIEQEEHSLEIAKARIEYWKKQADQEELFKEGV